MKKIVAFLSAITIFNANFSYSAENFDKYSLLDAVADNNLARTKRYLDGKYDINLTDEYGNTALSYAIYNKNYEISKLLLKNGANPKIKDSTGKMVYCSAKTSSDEKIRNLFKKYSTKDCGNVVAKNAKNASTKTASKGFWNWKTVGGAAITVGAVAALAGGGGGGGGDGDSGNIMSPADRNYGMVGDVDQTVLDGVLNDIQYSGTWELSNGAVYTNLNHFNEIRLAYSLARGYTGRINSLTGRPYYLSVNSTSRTVSIGDKIKVAVIDSGVLTTHEDLANNITSNLSDTNIAYLFCSKYPANSHCKGSIYLPNNPNPTFNTDDNKGGDSSAWHGTFVAGVIGASYSNDVGITGVAPESEIIPYRVTLDDGYFVNDYYLGEAFKYAANAGATVINNSYGVSTVREDGSHNIDASDMKSKEDIIAFYSDSFITSNKSNYITQMLNAVTKNDVIFVWAAGNDGTSQPGVESSIPLFFDEFRDGDYYKNFINVVAYDTDAGRIADYSNRCGVTKEYCLTAPGTSIISTISTGDSSKNDAYMIADGTSFAAPMVSGAVAVLKGAFPYLTGAEITKLLFITARDLGAPGVDEIYGWGMLDLERATRPVGATLVPIDDAINKRAVSLLSTNLKLNSTVANSIMSKDLKFVVLDSFNRTFDMKLNDYIETEKSRVNTIDILKKFGENNGKMVSVNNDKNFNLYYNVEATTTSLSQETELSYSVDSKSENRYGFNLYYGNNPYNAFVDNKVDFYKNYSLSNAYGYSVLNPYFKSNSDINFAFNNVIKVSDRMNLNLGTVYQNYTTNYDQTYNNRKKNEDLGAALSLIGGASYNLTKNIGAKLEFGVLNEYDTFFGTKWSGAFGLGGNNVTYMASVENNFNMFNSKLSLFGRANFGYTKVNQAANSLISDITGLYSNSYAVGLNYNFNSKYAGQRSNISFLLSQPIRINSGNFRISLPTSRDNDGKIYYDSHRINFSNDDEINLQLAYNYSVENDSSFNLGFVYRNYMEDEYIMLLKYKKAFSF